MDDDLELMEFESCPKCGFDNNADAESCGRCGIVFSKYDPASDPDKRVASAPEGGPAQRSRPSTSSSPGTFDGGAFTNLPLGKVVVVLLVVAAAGYWWMSKPYEVVGAELGSGSPTVILLHGHGAPGDDLVRVSQELSERAPGVTFLVPAGPHSKMFGRSWMNGGSLEQTNAEVEESRDLILSVVEDAEAKGVASEDIYIGGFSQGGQMALDIVGGAPLDRQFGGLFIMSGGWPNWPSGVPPIKSDNLAPDARAFMTHGKNDNIFSTREAKDIAKQLRGQGVDTRLEIFSGGHTIERDLLDQSAGFLSAH